MRYFPILALTFALGLPAAARAEMLPDYDLNLICGNIAGTSARPEMYMRGCLDFEERTRKEIALVWDKLPAAVQESCAAKAKASGDYWKLKTCLEYRAPEATASEVTASH
jgi:hypothetical protein